MLLPNIPDLNYKTSFLFKLITEYLPKIVPNLCSKKVKRENNTNWRYSPEYEIPRIQRVKNKLEIIEAEYEKRVSKIEIEIEKERKKLDYWHDLITATDKQTLIDAVKKALETLGFKEIIQPDKEEDLQIKDYSPILLLEILGILDRQINEVKIWKYLALRMQEYKTFEIQEITIVNYQNNLPPLKRDNQNIFSENVLNKAKEYNLGLMTTWDIYRLMRNYFKLGWKHEQIQAIFYQTGRINIIPSHYQYIGTVEKFYKSKNLVEITIEQLSIQKDDRIAFDFPIEFSETKIERIDPDNLIEIEIDSLEEQLIKGTRIFKVVNS